MLRAAWTIRSCWYVLVLLFTAAAASAAVPLHSGIASGRTTVFTFGEGGYPCIRTPALIRTTKSLLAFAGTRCSGGDGCFPHNKTSANSANRVYLVMKRSTDNGITWGPLQVLYQVKCRDRDHGTPVFDATRGRVVLVMRGFRKQTLSMYSDDDGVSWSSPTPVPLGNYSKSRVSPGVGVQLRPSNPHAPGRLVFVSQLGSGGDKWKRGNVVYFSDDGGVTWKWSHTIVPDCQEAQIVELSNGTLLMNARRGLEGGHIYNRLFATSNDGGVTWSRGTIRSDLNAASCEGSFISYGNAPHLQLLYAHPAAFVDRANGTVWCSNDDGASFRQIFQVSPSDHSESFAYSSMSSTRDVGTVALLYETSAKSGCHGDSCTIAFLTFKID